MRSLHFNQSGKHRLENVWYAVRKQSQLLFSVLFGREGFC